MESDPEVRFVQRCVDFLDAAAEGVELDAWGDEARALRHRTLESAMWTLLASAGIGVLVMELLGLLDPDFREPEALLIAGGIGAIIGAFRAAKALRGLLGRRSLKARQVHATITAAAITEDTPAAIRLTADAMVFRTPTRETRWVWPAVWRVDELSRWDAITTYDFKSVLIPKAAFADDGARRRFLDAIRAHNEAAGGDGAVIVRWLSGHDLHCPGCKYPLRGLGDAVCPECAEPVTLEHVQRAHTGMLCLGAPTPPERP